MKYKLGNKEYTAKELVDSGKCLCSYTLLRKRISNGWNWKRAISVRPGFKIGQYEMFSRVFEYYLTGRWSTTELATIFDTTSTYIKYIIKEMNKKVKQ